MTVLKDFPESSLSVSIPASDDDGNGKVFHPTFYWTSSSWDIATPNFFSGTIRKPGKVNFSEISAFFANFWHPENHYLIDLAIDGEPGDSYQLGALSMHCRVQMLYQLIQESEKKSKDVFKTTVKRMKRVCFTGETIRNEIGNNQQQKPRKVTLGQLDQTKSFTGKLEAILALPANERPDAFVYPKNIVLENKERIEKLLKELQGKCDLFPVETVEDIPWEILIGLDEPKREENKGILNRCINVKNEYRDSSSKNNIQDTFQIRYSNIVQKGGALVVLFAFLYFVVGDKLTEKYLSTDNSWSWSIPEWATGETNEAESFDVSNTIEQSNNKKIDASFMSKSNVIEEPLHVAESLELNQNSSLRATLDSNTSEESHKAFATQSSLRATDQINSIQSELTTLNNSNVSHNIQHSINIVDGWHRNKLQKLQRATARNLQLSVFVRDRLRDGGSGPQMVLIPAGRFSMGSPVHEVNRGPDETHPFKYVTIESSFLLAQREVSVGEFMQFVESTGYKTDAENGEGCWTIERDRTELNRNWRNPGYTHDNSYPVSCINLNDAMAYLNWLSLQSGEEYRLPSEAEWEYACRAGTTGSYNFGQITPEKAAYKRKLQYTLPHSNIKEQVSPSPVGSFSKSANAFSLQDMHGNLLELTGSVYSKGYNGQEMSTVSIESQVGHVLRGGSWNSGPEIARCASRIQVNSLRRSHSIGFRIARNIN